MARSGVSKAEVQAARLALIARGENPSIDAVRIEMGNTGSKTTIHRFMRELDEHDTGASPPQIDDELLALVSRLASRLREQAQEHIDEAQARLDAEKKALQDTLQQTQRQLADLIERHALQTTKLGTQTATLLSTQHELQTEQKHNARLVQAAKDVESRLQDKDEQIRSLKEQHLQSHTQCALLQERLNNAIKESEKIQERLTERDQQNRVLELILIKTEVALENVRAGQPAAPPSREG
ncbi:DNA-binding protein [Pseudomonas abietaniphila]|uniref:Replication region DNA-binding N-term n=1 Tax=Pseudomonas abietaniphila TaxID=89065 RepID=A0A1G7U4T1_9PSED|nr:DNA-binding protein [Pseudomonas abietaniphila]SDG41760.1 replication region DNA-binding N-term [Pseudomonas abietaniphila]